MSTKSLSWLYMIATAVSIMAILFLALLESLFIRSWSNSKIMYLPSVITLVAALFLTVSTLIRSRTALRLKLVTVASVASILMTCLFLLEIVPIAQGNNDSGEVFWFVVLPTIGLLAYAYFSYLKLKTFLPDTR
jgi:hypothetical protein